MDGYARVAERGEKVIAVGGVPMPGGMLGYGVAAIEGSPDLDPDLASADPSNPNDKRELAEKIR
jgi:hypothetical protein